MFPRHRGAATRRATSVIITDALLDARTSHFLLKLNTIFRESIYFVFVLWSVAACFLSMVQQHSAIKKCRVRLFDSMARAEREAKQTAQVNRVFFPVLISPKKMYLPLFLPKRTPIEMVLLQKPRKTKTNVVQTLGFFCLLSNFRCRFCALAGAS